MKRGLFVGALIVLASVLPFGRSIEAHGGGELVAGNVPTGPYSVSVWVNPPQPRVDEPVHFTVGVAAPRSGAPVLDTQIEVTLRAQSADTPAISAPATTEQSINRLFYETDMQVETVDRYAVTVDVEGPDGGGTVDFEIDVQPRSRFNWFWIGIGGLLVVLALGWLRSRTTRVSVESEP